MYIQGDGGCALIEAEVNAGFFLLCRLTLALEGARRNASLTAFFDRWIDHGGVASRGVGRICARRLGVSRVSGWLRVDRLC